MLGQNTHKGSAQSLARQRTPQQNNVRCNAPIELPGSEPTAKFSTCPGNKADLDKKQNMYFLKSKFGLEKFQLS